MNLLKIKTIVTLGVMLVFIAQALRGAVTPDSVMYVVMTVVAFYFGSEKDGGDKL